MEYQKILNRKLEKLFPDNREKSKAVDLLETYGIEKHELEPFRVRLAILKLCDGDLEAIAKTVKYARQDYRDILSWAEYPRQSKKWSMHNGPEKENLVKKDREEYEQWLNEK